MTQQYEKFLIAFSSVLAMLYLWASDMYLPAFVEMAETFQTTEANIGNSLSIFFLGLAFSQLFFGSISDQFGRKPLLIIGLTIFIAGCLGCYYCESIEAFMVFRVVTAIGACATMVLWQAIVVDSFEEKKTHNIFAAVYMLLGMSPALAPGLGGLITEYSDWRYIFLFLCFYGAVLWLLSVLIFRESISTQHLRPKLSIKKIIHGYAELLMDRFFVCMSFAVGLLVGLYMIYISLVPFIFEELGYTPKEIGLLFIPIAISFMVGSKIASFFSRTKTVDQIIRFGMFSTVLGSVGMYASVEITGLTNAWQMIIPMMFLTFCNGVAIPFSVSRIIQSFPHISGTASSAVGFLIAFIPFGLIYVGMDLLAATGYLALIWLLLLSSLLIAVLNILANFQFKNQNIESSAVVD